MFEIDRNCTVSFATGAASEFVRDGELVGRGAARLFEPSDGIKFVTFAKALGRGGRAGPLKLKLVGGTPAIVAFCHLPQNEDRISCTLAKTGPRTGFESRATDGKTGLADRNSFLAAAKSMSSPNDTLTLVDVPGLKAACAKLPGKESDKLLARIGEEVKAGGDKTAARLGATKFGAIGPASPSKKPLADRIRGALNEGGVGSLSVDETSVSLKGEGLSPDQRILAVRYVVEKFAASGRKDMPNELGEAFTTMLGETEKRAMALTKSVADGAFALAYQPIYELASGTLTHFETLTRFNRGADTGETIKFAEALGIADAFDLAVAARVMAVAEDNPGAAFALNLSGHSLIAPASFAVLAGLLARKRKLAKTVLLEITETAEIADLAAANAAVQVLREMGYRVGLDDFGSGAASLQYLHAFTVDFVKFDGSLIKKIGGAKRDDLLLAGMVKMCGELDVETIAECVENADIKKRCLEMGFDLGQGYYLGKPADKPVMPGAQGAKRKGVVESWG